MLTSKRIRRILAGLTCLFVAGVVVYVIIPPKPSLSRENFRLVTANMTKEQIDAILGTEGKLILSKPDEDLVGWSADNNFVMVRFHANQAVGGAFRSGENGKIEPIRAEPDGLLALFLRRAWARLSPE